MNILQAIRNNQLKEMTRASPESKSKLPSNSFERFNTPILRPRYEGNRPKTNILNPSAEIRSTPAWKRLDRNVIYANRTSQIVKKTNTRYYANRPFKMGGIYDDR